MSRILHLTADATFYLYRKPVRMSYSFDRLAAIIRSELDKDLISGDLFIFLNRQRTMIKLLLYENKGYSIFYRRLDEGSFQLPLIASDHISYRMNEEQVLHMLSGVTLLDGGYLSKEKYVPLHGSM